MITKRAYLEKTYNCYYKRKFRFLDTCIYCGQTADSEDHVFPISRLDGLELFRPGVRNQFLPHGLCIVKSCWNCNSIASDHSFISILKKRDYIQSKLKEKYGNNFVDWTNEELTELGYSLRQYVIRKSGEDNVIFSRIHHPKLRKLFNYIPIKKVKPRLTIIDLIKEYQRAKKVKEDREKQAESIRKSFHLT